MFSKNEGAGRAGRATPMRTYLAAQTNGSGQIISGGNVEVAGQFDGYIIAHTLTVLEGGAVSGNVKVQTLHIEGGYTGEAEAYSIKLGAQSKTKGRLTYQELTVSLGARIDALCGSSNQPNQSAHSTEMGAAAVLI